MRIAALSSVTPFALTGVALASCPAQPVSNPFAQWGDMNDYFLVPGGSFEGSADQLGWTLSGASLTQGNEPFDVGSATDAQSLTINAGGSATSPPFCIDNTMSGVRLIAQELTGGSNLAVSAIVQNPDGTTMTVPIANVLDGTLQSWGPTSVFGRDGQLFPREGNALTVALSFSVPASSGSWQLDDVYVDPYRSG